MDLNMYIPPSDEDTDDQENFQLFLQKNTATPVSNPEYQPGFIHNSHQFKLRPHGVSTILIFT